MAAREKDADAVVGITVDYEMVREAMMMVTATGTAVVEATNEPGQDVVDDELDDL